MRTVKFHIKRIYREPSQEDGYRVLVDRLWPRGVSRDKAKLDEWLKEIAPSAKLRKWFNHDPEKFDEFSERYKGELNRNKDMVTRLLTAAGERNVTLLYAARDEVHNHAVVLKEFLDNCVEESD